MSTSEAIKALEEASEGLSYQSESDEPFTAFTWKKAEGELTADVVRKRARKKGPVEEVSLDDFFADLTAEDAPAVKQYRRLLEAINKNLTGVKVFKVGGRKKAVFIAGKTDEGDFAGLRTTAVET